MPKVCIAPSLSESGEGSIHYSEYTFNIGTKLRQMAKSTVNDSPSPEQAQKVFIATKFSRLYM